ncbi:UNVERIFIED_ORG: hypothetical protein M2348_001635 [Sphingomonas sp. R1F5B]|uniref:hypothetical protein n=1 Tax=Novosphingobium sp. AAP1 TaxID=1523413 RepID=UPI0012E0D55E|nr:hypothetical protein [Novosphingobium sp. AAP1]
MSGVIVFCPADIEWGSVADWFSAIGTILAVVMALGLALWEHFKSKAAADANRAQQAEIVQRYENYRLELYRKIILSIDASLAQSNIGPFNATIGSIITQIRHIELLPGLDPVTFLNFHELLAFCSQTQMSTDRAWDIGTAQAYYDIRTECERRIA